MKSSRVPFRLILAALFPFLLGQSLQAQQAGNPVFELRKFHIEQPKSPDYNEDSFDYTVNSENWLQVVCEYRVSHPDGWLDNVAFKWHLHLLDAETERLVLTKTVVYDNVEADGQKSQLSVVYMSPRAIRRYYSSRNATISSRKVVIFIEVQVDGIKMAEFRVPDGRVSGVPPQWWLSRQVNRVENALLSRLESPWSVLDYDTWVPERPSEKPVAH